MARPRRSKKSRGSHSGDWMVSHQRLREAIQVLGLTMKVKVRPMSIEMRYSDEGLTNGHYFHRGCNHIVYLWMGLSMQKASSTLWHELGHAYQNERRDYSVIHAIDKQIPVGIVHNNEDVYLDKAETDEHARDQYKQYYASRKEREARGIANEFDPLLRLTVPKSQIVR